MEDNLKIILEWDRILSYQAGLKKSPHGKYFTKQYKRFKFEADMQLLTTPNLDASGLYNVDIDCYFKFPKSISKKKKEQIQATEGDIWCSKNIDRDNIIKGINDILEDNGVIINDRYIVDGRTRKLMDKNFTGKEWVEITITKVGTMEEWWTIKKNTFVFMISVIKKFLKNKIWYNIVIPLREIKKYLFNNS